MQMEFRFIVADGVHMNADWHQINGRKLAAEPSQSLFEIHSCTCRGDPSLRIDEQAGIGTLEGSNGISQRTDGTLFIRPLDRKSPNLAEKGVLAHLLILHQGSRLLTEAEFIQQQRDKSIRPRVVVKIINRFCVIIWMIILF